MFKYPLYAPILAKGPFPVKEVEKPIHLIHIPNISTGPKTPIPGPAGPPKVEEY